MRFTLVVLVALSASPATASPVQWPLSGGGNGHYYEYVANYGLTWTQALNDAAVMTWSGAPGHLATITNQAENDWVWATLDPSRAWLGGYQDADAPSSSAGWHWVTGEPWIYTNWHSGEPNDLGTKNEWALHFDQYSFWNDVDGTNDNTVPGFVVEYETVPVPVEGTTWGHIKALYR